LEDDAIAGRQGGLLGGDVDAEVRVEIVEAADDDAVLLLGLGGEPGVDGGSGEVRMEEENRGGHRMPF
jgi:hypothetical protein